MAAVSSVLGFVDVIVHSIAVEVLEQQLPREAAIRQLRKHTDQAAALVDALLSNVMPQANSSSGSDSDEHLEQPVTAPWNVNGPTNQSLHQEIVRFADWVRPGSTERDARAVVIQQVTAALQKVCPGCVVEQYGSASTGIDMFCSDLDLSVSPRLPLKEVAAVLAEEREPASGVGPPIAVGSEVRLDGLKARPELNGQKGVAIAYVPEKERWNIKIAQIVQSVSIKCANLSVVGSVSRCCFRDIEVIGARTPIVTFEHARSGVAVDISNATEDAEDGSSALVGVLSEQFPFLGPLALTMKVLLMQSGLHEVYHGGLGSFRLYMLLAAWLQAASRPDDLGECLVGFLITHAKGMPAELVVRGLSVEFGGLRTSDVEDMFRRAAMVLSQKQTLSAVVDAAVLNKMWLKSQRKATVVVEEKRKRGQTDSGDNQSSRKKQKLDQSLFRPNYG